MYAAALTAACAWLLAADAARAADAHVIAVSVAPEQNCPGPRQVTDALTARLPGAVLPPGQPTKPGMLRLAVAAEAAGGIRIDLADPEGAPLLHRVLAVTRGPGECAALADTIALIIERYWREVGYDAPPLAPPTPPPPPPSPPPPPPAPPPHPSPPPPEPAAVESRSPRRARRRRRARSPLALVSRRRDRRPRRRRRHARRLGADRLRGRGTHRHPAVRRRLQRDDHPAGAWGRSDFRRFPLRLGGYLPIPIGVGQLEPGLGFDLDLLSLSIRDDGGRTDRSHRASVPGGCAGPPAPIWPSAGRLPPRITSTCGRSRGREPPSRTTS